MKVIINRNPKTSINVHFNYVFNQYIINTPAALLLLIQSDLYISQSDHRAKGKKQAGVL